MTPKTASSLPEASGAAASGSALAADTPYHILINGHSGAARKKGETGFAALRDATRLRIASYDFHTGDDFDERLRALMRGDGPVLIGGGDGTIALAAAAALEADKAFGILPMGTMNMLARDLGVPSVLEAKNIFDLYATARIEAIDVGLVNGRPFLCCAALGAIPAASQYRERFRRLPDILMIPQMVVFVMQRLSAVHRRHVRVTIDGRTTRLKTASLVVSDNPYAALATAKHKLAKESLHGDTLGIYSAAPKSFMERVSLLFHLQQGDLEADRALIQDRAKEVVVRTRRRKEWVSIDGEPVRLRTPLHFTIRHDGLKMILPGRTDG